MAISEFLTYDISHVLGLMYFFMYVLLLSYIKYFPGGKKKQRKEKIYLKRRDRMLNRGVDLEQINLVFFNINLTFYIIISSKYHTHFERYAIVEFTLQKLNQLVLDGTDIFSFQPMHSYDCSQVITNQYIVDHCWKIKVIDQR